MSQMPEMVWLDLSGNGFAGNIPPVIWNPKKLQYLYIYDKSSNILLDSELKATVADFGIARMLVQAGTPDTMSAVAGSFGYMAPVCACTRKVNEKVDVYSFGVVVLLELTTGREANDGGEHGALAEWAWWHFQSGKSIADAADKCIRDVGYGNDVEVVFKLGIICIGAQLSIRPTINDMLQMLLRCEKAQQKTVDEKVAEFFLQVRGAAVESSFRTSKGLTTVRAVLTASSEENPKLSSGNKKLHLRILQHLVRYSSSKTCEQSYESRADSTDGHCMYFKSMYIIMKL